MRQSSRARDDVGTAVSEIRAFNRFYTNVIGALRGDLLGVGYSLTEARVIFELAQHDTVEVADLRRSLDIDPGYLSRILARFEERDLVSRDRSSDDRRRHVVRLTPRGRTAFLALDDRADAEVRGLLGQLGAWDHRRLLGAMRAIREILGDAAQSDHFLLRPPAPGDYGWVVQRHGALYAQEYGWDETFEALVARIIADYVEHHDPKREAGWIAEVDGEPAGCVFCVRSSDTTAKLRLLLVEPAARGMGIGSRLVEECLRFARRCAYRDIVLWTNDVLHDARRIYERAGFELVDEEPHHSFGHDLVGQTWRLDLHSPPDAG
jgi:DNA-binding MarR family transcriptional regulator/N-acetylglutamate synthase-like GNAT family acetyltransferase